MKHLKWIILLNLVGDRSFRLLQIYLLCLDKSLIMDGQNISTEMGFEPTHGDRIGLAVQRLNHSATLS